MKYKIFNRYIILIAILIFLSTIFNTNCVFAISSQTILPLSWLINQGIIKGSNGDLMLENPVSKAEAAVLVVKLLYKESAINNQSIPLPFNDIPSWAKDSISLLYKSKLINGITKDKYGSNQAITSQQFISLILKVLGYSTEFSNNSVLNHAASIGLIKTDEIDSYLKKPFIRQQATEIMFSSLFVKMKGKDILAKELLKKGILSKQAFNELPAKKEDIYVLSGRIRGIKDTRRYWYDYFSKLSFNMESSLGSVSIPSNLPIWFGKMLQVDIEFYLKDKIVKGYTTIIPEYKEDRSSRYTNAGIFTNADDFDQVRYIVKPVTEKEVLVSLKNVTIEHKNLSDKESLIQQILKSPIISYTVSDESAKLPDWRSIYMLNNMDVTKYPDGRRIQASYSSIVIDPSIPTEVSITEGIGDLTVTNTEKVRIINITVTNEDLIQCLTLYDGKGSPVKNILLKP